MTGMFRFFFVLFIFVVCFSSSPIQADTKYWRAAGVIHTDPESACRALTGEAWTYAGMEVLGEYSVLCHQEFTNQYGQTRRSHYNIHAFNDSYALAEPLDDFVPENCGIGNPIDPVTGNKFQQEPVVRLDGPVPLALDLYYNSHRNEKWRHSYARSATLLSAHQLPRYRFSDIKLCVGQGMLESPGGVMGGYEVAGGAMVFAGQYYAKTEERIMFYSTREAACQTGWARKRSGYHYSWVNGSYAEYAGGNECAVFDADGRRRMTMSIYGKFAGASMMADAVDDCALADLGTSVSLDGSEDVYLRFVRHTGQVRQFRYDHTTGEWLNQHHSGERAELVYDGDVLSGYRLYTAADEIETYDSQGRLTSIVSLNGHVTTLSYDGGSGLLQRVASQTGGYLDFSYESYGNDYRLRLGSVSDQADRSWGFSYDTNGLLSAVEFPDSTSRQYHYESGLHSGLLTGITDRRGIRYAHWTYNRAGKADTSAHGPDGDIDRVGISYAANGERTVTSYRYSPTAQSTTPIVSTYSTDSVNGHKQVARIQGPDCCGGASNVESEQDPNTGYLIWKIQQGVKFEYGNYDDKGNPGYVIEAVDTDEARRTNYLYDTRFHSKIAVITEPSVYTARNKVTRYSYDDYGNLTELTLNGFQPDGTAVSRTTRLQYQGPYHQLTQIDGPRSDVDDVVLFDYYPDDAAQGHNRARLRSVRTHDGTYLRNNITYTATGKLETEDRSNNLHIAYTYYPGNDRLQYLVQTDTASGQSRTTRWTYLDSGQVASVTHAYDSPDEVTLTLGYDGAQRLTRLTDGLGNAIEYILDSEGNVEQENIHDDTGALRKTLSQTFDGYNRLDNFFQGNENRNTDFNADGTLGALTDGDGNLSQYGYDNLKRLTAVTRNSGGSNPATADALVQYGYDSQDNLVSVIDANANETSYTYDDLGNLLELTGPDTGTTRFTYDEAGNVLTKQDAKDQQFSYRHDAQNRLTAIDAPGSDHDISYTYDHCVQGQFRPCSVTCGTQAPVTYQYNAFGDITRHQGVVYIHDDAGRIESIAYPSGSTVTYHYDDAGQVQRLALEQGGMSTDLAQSIGYAPFGEVSQLVYGSGLDLSHDVDEAYRTLNVSVPSALSLAYSEYDANGNLLSVSDSRFNQAFNYEYDELQRLSRVVYDQNDTDNGDLDILLSHDKNGNRTSYGNQTHTVDTGSNWIGHLPPYNLPYDDTRIDYEKDANGNRILKRHRRYYYDDDEGAGYYVTDTHYRYSPHNRLTQVRIQYTDQGTDGSIRSQTTPETIGQYTYNGLGQRTRKIADLREGDSLIPQVTTNFTYGLNGELLSETNSQGDSLDYIYLGNKPIALVRNGLIYYIHTDHIGTPRSLTDSNSNLVWRHDPTDGFGGRSKLYSYPDSQGAVFSFNLRFAGQYYDWETKLHYNCYRYYDPGLGRYITSDPIGLAGGLNTYAYVENNPLKYTDPLGLNPYRRRNNPRGGGGGFASLGDGWNWDARNNNIRRAEARWRERERQRTLEEISDRQPKGPSKEPIILENDPFMEIWNIARNASPSPYKMRDFLEKFLATPGCTWSCIPNPAGVCKGSASGYSNGQSMCRLECR